LWFSSKIFKGEGLIIEEASAKGIKASWAQVWHVVVAGELVVEQEFWVLGVRVKPVGFNLHW
jgi:hypothetical protein